MKLLKPDAVAAWLSINIYIYMYHKKKFFIDFTRIDSRYQSYINICNKKKNKFVLLIDVYFEKYY